MSTISRQNALFVAEDWSAIYEALNYVDFRAYSFETLVQSIVDYCKVNYPDDFNDWIASSEFITHVEVLAWLSQNLAFRVDLNSRENFMPTAERRNSILRLASFIAYKVNRVQGLDGFLRIDSIATNQPYTDVNGNNLQNLFIYWNDQQNEDWYDQFVTILNLAFINRTQFGNPFTSSSLSDTTTEQYVFNSYAPSTGVYSFETAINGVTLDMEVYNGVLNATTGVVAELVPNIQNALNIFYMTDGLGYTSSNTGFFLPIKQGKMNFVDVSFTDPTSLQVYDISTPNIDADDVWVQRLDTNGNVLENWNEVDTVFGEGVAFNTLSVTTTATTNAQKIFEVDTLMNDQIRIRFGDGSFGEIPQGNFRIWFRTVNPVPLAAKAGDIQNIPVTIPYAYGNQVYYLTMNLSLTNNLNNGAFSETNLDIKNRAGKFFYTQNRMVTGQDYNNYFLSDNSIRKVKTVNRTFAGHSRYAKLHDPTSLYENVKQYAEDGRLYQDVTTSISLVDGNVNTMPISNIISNNIAPLLVKENKTFLYNTQYQEMIFNNPNYTWINDVVVSGFSRGRISLYNGIQTVGPNAPITSPLYFIQSGAILRFINRLGETTTVDRIVNNGSALNGIWLEDNVTNGTLLYSVMPAFRNTLLTTEISLIGNMLAQKTSFGIGWNQQTASWVVITSKNLDTTSGFSLVNQGNTSNKNMDNSWIVLCEYSVSSGSPQWKITDRGIGLFFESASEIDFIFVNSDLVNDVTNNTVAQDAITVLPINETRDSLNRRGVTGTQTQIIVLTGVLTNNATTLKTDYTDLDIGSVVVYVNDQVMVPTLDYTFSPVADGDVIVFNSVPNNASYEIWITGDMTIAIPKMVRLVGDGDTSVYDLGFPAVNNVNTFSFWDGVYQNTLDDYYIFDNTVNNSTISFKENIPAGTVSMVNCFSGTISPSFIRMNFIGDGSTTAFAVPTESSALPIPFITLDGIVQSTANYSLSMVNNSLLITFTVAPISGIHLRVIVPRSPKTAKVAIQTFNTDGITATYTLNYPALLPEQILVSLGGVNQIGQYYTNNDWTLTDNKLTFTNVPLASMEISVYMVLVVVGKIDTNPTATTSSNGLTSYLNKGYSLTPIDMLRYEDGYTNKNGVMVKPSDLDLDGSYDDPNVFKDFVIQDGVTDLVLWTKIQEYGFDLWEPIDKLTTTRGTYGAETSAVLLPASGYADPLNGVNPAVGTPFDPSVTNVGDIHYDITIGKWLVADGLSQTWGVAPDQTLFRSKIGRDHIKFVWTHYALEETIIDPSHTNVMNTYVLTQMYLDAYNSWIQTNQNGAEPVPETSAALKLQYQNFENYKMESDSIVFYPVRFKKLFGLNALPENQVTFMVIQSPGSNISEGDLKIQILNLIDNYFNTDNWDFGEVFYFTEMAAFIHQNLAPNIQAIVPVPYLVNYSFGNSFQIRAEPDELFISTANINSIQIVSSFTDEALKIISGTH